ncbi:mediator complex, subunit Med8 [Cercophora samala]|uniref:Mediator of RNA polymerase II transcription subunit 8 n=1 Tax=Cercophora samala TaxID=330535 RepID=A0AA39ZF27_9PEZI|nr:mediator complex, subunit Med8 [Cercophora samala]
MASLNLRTEELKNLDVLRTRFATLSLNLSNAHRNMALTYPLPSLESLQVSARMIQKSLLSLQSLLSRNHELFQRIAVHPSTNFPGRTQLDFLSSMLRKKPEPEIETKMEMGLERAKEAGVDEGFLAALAEEARLKRAGLLGGQRGGKEEEIEYDSGGRGKEGKKEEDEEDEMVDDGEPNNEQWADCLWLLGQNLHSYVSVQERRNFTLEEQEMGVERVRTGLRRNLVEEEEESDEEDEEDEEEEDEDLVMMDGSGGGRGQQPGVVQASGNAGVQPEHLFWLYARGRTDLPPRIELESNRVPTKGQVKRLPPR